MYSQDTQGKLIKMPFKSVTWSELEAATEQTGVSALYSIIDDSGVVTETGYQADTIYNEEAWLTVALPSEIKNVKIKMYDPDVKDWVDVLFKLAIAEEQTIENYTIWTVPEEYEIQSGDTYRFVIII